MRILYIGRHDGPPGLRTTLKQWQRSLTFGEQDGFFEASLYAAADITEITLTKFQKQPAQIASYDAVVINLKCGYFTSEAERDACLVELFADVAIPKALFVGTAKASYLPAESVLDIFDVIYKREPYKDRTRYGISSANQAKLVPTMISCPFVALVRPTLRSCMYHWFRSGVGGCASAEQTCDVGFSGSVAYTHTLRQDAWETVLGLGVSTIGGLQINPYSKQPIAEHLTGPRRTGATYRDMLCAARINLVIDGIGPYTFRHQEIFWVGGFVLSSASITELELPMPLTEGEHYVAYTDQADLAKKIAYYLEHETERQAIAAAGATLIRDYYQPAQHGAQLVAALKAAR